ncbi:MAG: class I tRNA ligase family protein [Patescibacteria group bacterium]
MPESNTKKTTPQREFEIQEFWQQNNIFKKALEKKSPKGEFVFYDGPPFATGLPHFGNLLPGTIKDVIPRYKTMQGYHVPRRWGWDCHGLPVENEVEKELGFKTKKDIENYGIAKFNAKAKEAVMRYASDWRAYIERMGRWVDMENDYRTMDSSYTESVWWAFKTLFEKRLIYEGWKSMHLCPRCETTLSNFEVTQNYKTLTDASVYVKFPISNPQFPNTYLIAWTTTPWTLPGNAALAVHPERDYAFVEITASNAPEIPTGDTFIVGAKEEILRRVFSAEGAAPAGGQGPASGWEFDPAARVGAFTWKGERVSFSARKGIKGKELVGQSYTPPFDFYSGPLRPDLKSEERSNLSRGWRIYAAEFVTEEDGTGIVHIAPAFGEDDYQLAVREKLPFIQHVAADGTFKKETGELLGLQAKPKGNPRETDEKIAAALAASGRLLRAESYTHEYPHCWRCETPLLNFAAPSWFVKVSGMREKLAAENKKVRWLPKDVGEYRFGHWLSEARDWAISRSRYWGAPIPVWRCTRCSATRVIGSREELRKGSKEALTALVFVRHGESKKNTEHVFDDSPEGFPLTHRGKSEAKGAARRIAKEGGADVIYSSPVRRARETALIIGAELKREMKVVEDLREVDSGAWDGKREDDASILKERAALAGLGAEEYYHAKRGGAGESWEDVERRMSAALATILARHRGERVVVVSHEGPIIFALKALEHLTLAETDKFYERDMLNGSTHPLTVFVSARTGKVFDLHRPFIDEVLLHCDECARTTGSGGNLMRRAPEVFDCWFESGSMPFAQAHYPFAQKGSFDPVGGWFRAPRGYPADFIAEGLDQTRGWFYSLLVLGTALFEKTPYAAVVVNGIILAENGEKMSKRLKNYPDPMEVVGRYGADALRYYLLSSPVVRGEELRFSERGVDEAAKKVLHRLDNVLQFYLLYSDSLFTIRYTLNASHHVLDKWIHARLNQLIAEVTEALESYELDRATRPIGEFIDDLSTWYLRRSRERIKSDVLEEKEAALGTLRFVLRELAKVMAPFTPFFAEYLYQSVHNANATNADANTANVQSVHLEDWPRGGKAGTELLKEMEEVRRVVSLALEARAKANIKVRQPLQKLRVSAKGGSASGGKSFSRELSELIQDEANVKEIVFDETLQTGVALDTALTPELKDEGQFRELARFVQEMRKKGGFKAGEPATLSVGAQGSARRFVEQHEDELSRIASLKNIVVEDACADGESFQADELLLSLRLSRD